MYYSIQTNASMWHKCTCKKYKDTKNKQQYKICVSTIVMFKIHSSHYFYSLILTPFPLNLCHFIQMSLFLALSLYLFKNLFQSEHNVTIIFITNKLNICSNISQSHFMELKYIIPFLIININMFFDNFNFIFRVIQECFKAKRFKIIS